VLALVLLLSAAAIAVGVASAARNEASRSSAASPNLLLGVTDVARFKSQTGQSSNVDQAFLGWGQGEIFGSPFAQLFELFGPIPIFHLGTRGANGGEAITPAGIAAGKGDSYLIALNNAISSWGEAIYVRPMAEMNNANNLYAGFNANGTRRDAAHAPARYREAFARIYVILHGGTASAVNAKLNRLGLPPVQEGVPYPNPFPRLRVVWGPLASNNPRVAGNTPMQYFPGAAYVDVIGGDIYNERPGDTAPWAGLDALLQIARDVDRPFSIPEFGLTDFDSPAAVRHLCSFLKDRPRTEVALYFNSKPGSRYDLGSKPLGRAAYRACVTPLAGALPDWAAANAPGAGARVTTLKLTPSPAAGATPLAVTFSIAAKLTVPIQGWLLVFDDGTEATGDGPPPATVKHTYAKKGIYPATLIVYPFPPFAPMYARFYTSADVNVGTNATPVVGFKATPTSGPAPLAVSFRTELDLAGPVTSWRLVFGDGKTRTGSGAPPQFDGHTYATAGAYNVLLIVKQGDDARFLATAKIAVGAAAGARGTGG
jgi:hypothetical protein